MLSIFAEAQLERRTESVIQLHSPLTTQARVKHHHQWKTNAIAVDMEGKWLAGDYGVQNNKR